MDLNQTEQEPQQLLWRSNSQPESMVTVTLGRVMNTLLTARPKKLHDSISRLSPDDKTASLGTTKILSYIYIQVVAMITNHFFFFALSKLIN